jgi:hypothetical protein
MEMHPTRSWSHLMAAAERSVAAITGVSACSSSTPAEQPGLTSERPAPGRQ